MELIPTLPCSPHSNDKGSASNKEDIAEDPLSDNEDYGEWIFEYWVDHIVALPA